MSLNIMDKLDQNINSDPNTNYEILKAEIVNAREKHISCKLNKLNIINTDIKVYIDNSRYY